MVIAVKVRRVGTSLGVILPKDKLSELGVREGDTVVIRRLEKPVPEVRGILKGKGLAFEREHREHAA